MKIRMYNVGFGDCFLMREKSSGGKEAALLVDFGSDTPGRLSFASQDIANACMGTELSVLLTHFHKDHINGLWETPLLNSVKLKNIYIPDIFKLRNVSGTKLDFLQLSLLSDIFSSLVVQKRPVEITLYTLLQTMMNHRSRLCLLSRGLSFDFASQEYQVLWPSIEGIRIDPRVEESVISLLERRDLISYRNERVYIEPLDSFIDRLSRGYEAFAGEGNRDVNWQELQESFESMSDFFRDGLEGATEEIKEKLPSIKNQGNKISIVFQDRAACGASKLLMTGDVTAPILKKLAANRIQDGCMFRVSDRYQAIKAPHHGTSTHFVPVLPPCETILISNGSPDAIHRNWGKISYQYGSFYGSHRGCQIKCTNPRCELRSLPSVKSCAACKLVPAFCEDISL